MKKLILLLCLIVTASFCFSACNKTEKKTIPQAKIEEKQLPEFEDYLEAFINNDESAIENLKKGEIAPCESVSSLIQYYLQDKDEDTCIHIVKLALDNKLTEYLLKTDEKKYINHPASQYAPALFWAMMNKNLELVELLLKNGADPNGDTAYSPNYMVEIDDSIDEKRMTPETGKKMKELLIQYGYKEKKEGN